MHGNCSLARDKKAGRIFHLFTIVPEAQRQLNQHSRQIYDPQRRRLGRRKSSPTVWKSTEDEIDNLRLFVCLPAETNGCMQKVLRRTIWPLYCTLRSLGCLSQTGLTQRQRLSARNLRNRCKSRRVWRKSTGKSDVNLNLSVARCGTHGNREMQPCIKKK